MGFGELGVAVLVHTVSSAVYYMSIVINKIEFLKLTHMLGF